MRTSARVCALSSLYKPHTKGVRTKKYMVILKHIEKQKAVRNNKCDTKTNKLEHERSVFEQQFSRGVQNETR